jgi:carbon-monoxide dehydrogenase medium subunit
VKPPPFAYHAPESVDEAVTLLSELGEDAKPLAGGQSLVPLLNFRLIRPSMLIDLGRIAFLKDLAVGGDSVDVGAMVPTARLLASEVAASSPVLTAAAKLVGHPQIRSRGTVGGSLAHADPAAELPAAAVLLGATVQIQGVRGRRVLSADSLVRGVFQTACEPDELIVRISFPRPAPSVAWAFEEFSRRRGDFALAGVGVLAEGANDTVAFVRVVTFGSGSRPLRAHQTEAQLLGRRLDSETCAAAREKIVSEVEVSDSLHASADYRRTLTGVLFDRALRTVMARA